MFSMNYDFEMQCYRKQGSLITFKSKPGYTNLVFSCTVFMFLLLDYFVLSEKSILVIAVSVIVSAISLVYAVGCYQKESLLILNGIGVTVKKSTVWGTDSRYFDLSHIQDIVIIEAVSMQSICFQLVLIPKDNKQDSHTKKLFPLFKVFQPKLEHLKTVYRHAQEKLIIPREKMVER